MLKRVSFTISVLTALCGVYVLYSLTVTPFLTPMVRADAWRTRDPADDLPFEPPVGNMEDAARFLPGEDWAARAKYQIHSTNGVCYSPMNGSRKTISERPGGSNRSP